MISAHPEMLIPLQTVLGLEDLYDLLEVISVDAFNRQMLSAQA